MNCYIGIKRKFGQHNDDTTPITQIGTPDAIAQSRPTSASEVNPVVQDIQCINKQQASDYQVEKLGEEKNNLKKERKKSKKEKKRIKKEQLRTIEELNLEHQRSVEKQEEKIWRQELKIQELKGANDELLTRLSAIAGARLTDGNANIADLSDENRPTKLAEQFSELYDNEWTDAFEVLTANKSLSEEDACHTLLKALCTSYTKSKEKADNDRQNMTEAMKKFLGDKESPPELIKQLKDLRKRNFEGHTKLLQKECEESVKDLFPDEKIRNKKGLNQFLDKGLTLCWLMVIQDPPVFMDTHIKDKCGKKHNSNTLKPYTKSGQYIDYIVWPPLYLKEDGDMLCKGIAQFKSNLSSDDPPISYVNEEALYKLEQEPNEENQKPKHKQATAESSAHDVDTYHEKREASTFRDQMRPSDANRSSGVTPIVTENGKESENVNLNQKLKDKDKNNLKVDSEKNYTTDESLPIEEIETSEDLPRVNALVSRIKPGTQNISVKPITDPEKAFISEEKELDKVTEADTGHNLGLVDTSINKGSNSPNSKPDTWNESKSKATSSNIRSSAKKKKHKSNKTKEIKDEKSAKDLTPTESNPNTSTDVKNTKNESTRSISDLEMETKNLHTTGQNDDDSSKKNISKNHQANSIEQKKQQKKRSIKK